MSISDELLKEIARTIQKKRDSDPDGESVGTLAAIGANILGLHGTSDYHKTMRHIREHVEGA